MSYEILRRVGSGGQGRVYIGRGEVGEVALKEMRLEEDTGIDPERAARTEISRLQTVPEHANLVRFIEVVNQTEVEDPRSLREAAGGWFVVMSYVEGQALTDYPSYGKLSSTAWWQLLSQVLDGVRCMHSARKAVIHRDLKPDNIIVQTVDGWPRPIVVDFGTAKKVDSNKTLIWGYTPKYAPPEYKDPTYSQAPYDIYQLALISFEAMCGDGYYDDDRNVWAINEMQHELRLDGSPFRSALATGLEPAPNMRPQSIWDWVKNMVGVKAWKIAAEDEDRSADSGATTLGSSSWPQSSTSSLNLGFKEATRRITVKRLCTEIEEDFDLPSGSVALRTDIGESVASGQTHYGTLTGCQFDHDWDYADQTLTELADEVGRRFGVLGTCVEFRDMRPGTPDLYVKNTLVRTLRKPIPPALKELRRFGYSVVEGASAPRFLAGCRLSVAYRPQPALGGAHGRLLGNTADAHSWASKDCRLPLLGVPGVPETCGWRSAICAPAFASAPRQVSGAGLDRAPQQGGRSQWRSLLDRRGRGAGSREPRQSGTGPCSEAPGLRGSRDPRILDRRPSGRDHSRAQAGGGRLRRTFGMRRAGRAASFEFAGFVVDAAKVFDAGEGR